MVNKHCNFGVTFAVAFKIYIELVENISGYSAISQFIPFVLDRNICPPCIDTDTPRHPREMPPSGETFPSSNVRTTELCPSNKAWDEGEIRLPCRSSHVWTIHDSEIMNAKKKFCFQFSICKKEWRSRMLGRETWNRAWTSAVRWTVPSPSPSSAGADSSWGGGLCAHRY